MSSGNTTTIPDAGLRFRGALALAAVLACALLAMPRAAAAQARVSVLCYHAFRDAPLKKDPYGFTLEELASHIADLKKEGVRFISAADLLAGRVTGSNNVLVTVDDGHRSVYDAYREVFRPNGIRPLLAIYPNIIGKKDYALTWEQLAELAARGCDVAAHGFYHLKINRKLYEESPRDFAREITGSKKMLEEKLNRKITIFVYPFGVRSDITVRAVREAGYRCAFTIDRGAVTAPIALGDGAFELSRYMVTRGNWNYCFNQVMKNARSVAAAATLVEDRRIAREARRPLPGARPDPGAGTLLARETETAAKKPRRETKGAVEPAKSRIKKKDEAAPPSVTAAKPAGAAPVPAPPPARKVELSPADLHRESVTVAAPVQRVATAVRPDRLVEEWGGLSAVAAPRAGLPAARDETLYAPAARDALPGAAEFSAPRPPDAMKRDYREIRRRSSGVYRDVLGIVRDKVEGIRKAVRKYAVKNW